MKLLLTSAGLSNKSIKKAFLKLVGKPAKKIKVAFIPTASNIEEGDKCWLIEDLKTLQNMGFAQVDILDIAAVPKIIWESRLYKADVLFFGGGNTFYLMHWIKKSGLQEILTDLLKSRVWVGISAGSMVPGVGLINNEERFIAKNIVNEDEGLNGLSYIDFSLMPHYYSPLFKNSDEISAARIAKQFKEPMYAIDDNSAIVIDGNRFEVVSEGRWKKF